jgi:hypothetical protein
VSHCHRAASEAKLDSRTALAFVLLLAETTSIVHVTILTVSRSLAATGEPWAPLVCSFTWPAVVYALDILAWDWFFALSVLFAAPVFRGGGLEWARPAVDTTDPPPESPSPSPGRPHGRP